MAKMDEGPVCSFAVPCAITSSQYKQFLLLVNFSWLTGTSDRAPSSLIFSPLILEVAIISAELVDYYGVLSNPVLIFFCIVVSGVSSHTVTPSSDWW